MEEQACSYIHDFPDPQRDLDDNVCLRQDNKGLIHLMQPGSAYLRACL